MWGEADGGRGGANADCVTRCTGCDRTAEARSSDAFPPPSPRPLSTGSCSAPRADAPRFASSLAAKGLGPSRFHASPSRAPQGPGRFLDWPLLFVCGVAGLHPYESLHTLESRHLRSAIDETSRAVASLDSAAVPSAQNSSLLRPRPPSPTAPLPPPLTPFTLPAHPPAPPLPRAPAPCRATQTTTTYDSHSPPLPPRPP
jgi:hypothetical protein